MPDPVGFFSGLNPGEHAFSEKLHTLGGDDFWKELVDYQAGRAQSGPRPGYNYRTKKPREANDPTIKDITEALDALYAHWGSRGWAPSGGPPGKTVTMQEPPEYSGGLPGTVGETNPELLKKLLEQ